MAQSIDPLNQPNIIKDQPRYLTDDSIVKTDVGYERLIFIHLNRIAERATLIGMVPGSERAYLVGVEHLDAFMEGDKDEYFRREMIDVRQHFMRVATQNRANLDDEDDAIMTQRFAVSWLRALMRLAKRKGYTPLTQASDTIR